MADIFEQVDEALREDRMKTIWRRYGWMVIAGAVLIVVGTAAVVGWRAYERGVEEDNTLAFGAAIDAAAAAEPAEAVTILTGFAEGAEPSLAALARMRAAASAIEADDRQAAIALYESVAGTAEADPALRDMATVLGASLAVDSVGLDDIRTRLAALDESNNPWHHLVNEIIAAAAIRAGDLEMARERLALISDDPGAPFRLRSRATELLAAIGGGETAEEVPPADTDAGAEPAETATPAADEGGQ